MNVIILAGGLGTRFKEMSVFPKVLLPIPNFNSILESHIDKFHDVSLVINDRFYDMVVNYCKVNSLNINIIKSSNTNGSYNTICEIQDQIPNDDLLLVWSDLVVDDIDIDELFENVIFTKPGDYRYRADNYIYKTDGGIDGNVPGIYYIKSLSHLSYKSDNYDIADWFRDEHIPFITKPIQLTEYRDKEVYIDYLLNNSNIDNKTRFFNHIEVNDGVLTKSSNEEYHHLLEKEYDWYESYNILAKNTDNIPQNVSYKNGSMSMEYLKDYITFNDILRKSDKETQTKIFDNYRIALNNMHGAKMKVDSFEKDLTKEVITKTLDRCDKIKDMLIKYDRNELSELLNKVYNILLEKSGDEVYYIFGHGDLNGSNVMVSEQDYNIKFIDPRGYFGDTVKFIYEPYEYAKIRYCISGYDVFNRCPQFYGEDSNIEMDNYLIDMFYDRIPEASIYKYEIELLLGVIWVSLAGYISNDIIKANIAYEKGIKILKDLL